MGFLTLFVKLTGILIFVLILEGCVSDDPRELEHLQSKSQTSTPFSNVTSGESVPDNRFVENYRVLFFGNSHVSGLDHILLILLKANAPEADIHVVNLGGGFLDQLQSREQRASEVKGSEWTHLILQGQKYSQSGARRYSTSSAKNWIKLAKSRSVTPVLFPEHPQQHRPSEANYVHDLHMRIADQESSCVAPVGLVWNHVSLLKPELRLYSPDGNHANQLGKLLTAYVLYQVITGEDVALLPVITDWLATEPEQIWLKNQVSEFLANHESCPF